MRIHFFVHISCSRAQIALACWDFTHSQGSWQSDADGKVGEGVKSSPPFQPHLHPNLTVITKSQIPWLVQDISVYIDQTTLILLIIDDVAIRCAAKILCF